MVWHYTLERGFTSFYYSADNTKIYRCVLRVDRRVFNNTIERAFTPTLIWTVPTDGVLGAIVRYRDSLIVFYRLGSQSLVTRLRINDFGRASTAPNNVTELWTVETDVFGNFQFNGQGSDVTAGTMAWQGGTGGANADLYNVLNLENGDWKQIDVGEYAPASSPSDTPIAWEMGSRGVWNSQAGYFITTNAYRSSPDLPWAKVFIGRNANNLIPLSNILRWFSILAGFAPANIQISDVNDLVLGAYLEARVSIWTVLQNIATAFRIEIFESEGSIKFSKKIGGSVVTPDFDITADQLSSISSSDAPTVENPPLRSTQVDQSALPSEIEVRYLDPDIEYQVGVVSRKRTQFPVSTVDVSNRFQIEIPIIMTYLQALQTITNTLFDFYRSDTQHEFRLPPSTLAAEPGDIVRITIGNQIFLVKLTEGTINADFSISCVGTSFVNESIPVPIDGVIRPPNPDQGADNPNISRVLIFDLISSVIPPTAPNFDLLLGYLGTSSGQDGWQGVTVQISDDAVLYRSVDVVENDDQVVGRIDTAPSNQYIYATLEQNLIVSAYQGDLGNIPAVGDFGFIGTGTFWDMIFYDGFIDNMDGTYTLTNVRRGYNGTEWQIPLETSQLLFVPADTAIRIATFDISDLEITKHFRAVGFNENPNDATRETITLAGNGNRPFAPRNIHARRTGSGVDLSWNRHARSRGHDTFVEFAQGDPPLLIDADSYDIEIFDAAQSAIVETVNDNAGRTYSYVGSEFDAVTEIRVRVHQLNIAYGRGIAGEQVVEIEPL